MDGFGSINWWGFTPALDFMSIANSDDMPDHVNILLLGAGDCRHIFQTVAHSYRHSPRTINFYVIESALELYARDMLFLNLILEPQQRFGLQEKTELFLELYGNSLVRCQSMEYVQQVSTEFIKMITDFDYLQKKLPVVDLSNLKFKERDMLEGIFKFWRNTTANQFDIAKCWDLRLRQYLGVRYDAIPNVFDWDFHMKLADKGAGIIGARNYNRWRHKGIAFEIREGTYDTPNKTLASGMVFKHEGERLARRGYWGDIVVSPYVTFGVLSEELSFFKRSNNVFTKSSEDVCEFNILSLMHEITHHGHYQPPTLTDNKTATLSEVTEEDEVNEELSTAVNNVDINSQHCDQQSSNSASNSFKVFMLPLNSAAELVHRSKFEHLFHLIYISNSHANLLTQDLTSTFVDGATVIVDTAKFLLELSKDQTAAYVAKITSLAESVGCKSSQSEVDGEKDCFMNFIYHQPATCDTPTSCHQSTCDPQAT